jgi:hypothetical protein
MPLKGELKKVVKREEVFIPGGQFPSGDRAGRDTRYWVETLECGHQRTEFDRTSHNRSRICYTCTPRRITPKPQGIVETRDPETEKLLTELKSDADIRRHEFIPPIDWPLVKPGR